MALFSTLTSSTLNQFINQHTAVELDTIQAERIQHDSLQRKVDGIETYVAGGEIQAVYDDYTNRWHLSEDYQRRYVYDVVVAAVVREIYSGLAYLAEPEVTAFKLRCGLIIEHDKADAYPYVLHGSQGGEIDRMDNVEDLAEIVIDTLQERVN